MPQRGGPRAGPAPTRNDHGLSALPGPETGRKPKTTNAPTQTTRAARQDRLCHRVESLFSDCPKLPRVIDRRAAPSHGYRAVHVVVYPHGIPVEVQVRTRLQHEWAEAFERFADAVGRGVRYGEPPKYEMVYDQQNNTWITVPFRGEGAGLGSDTGTPAIHHLSELSDLIIRHEQERRLAPEATQTSQAEAEILANLRRLQRVFSNLADALNGRYGG
ncbi:RelA/SpoT domain-containing protein [Actinorugispora endophytica]|uniref:RelA/SpoT family protein n=1 Tax=Actinorugispora endophytica TaxID=1605990 RepID=A0A4R6V5T8_9ACTN|nr:RelA/SpoT domain-containing protein [Actinorugispora endophytica]TDQ53768.1 RelA/SpoT family protein [Actinorugispora endophytica]